MMARLVFSAPQRVMLRLKGDLAKELNTAEEIFDEIEEDIVEEDPTTTIDESNKLGDATPVRLGERQKKPPKFRTSLNYDEVEETEESVNNSWYEIEGMDKYKDRLSSVAEEPLESEGTQRYSNRSDGLLEKKIQ